MADVFIEDISSEFKTGKWTSVIEGMTIYRVFEDDDVYEVVDGEMVFGNDVKRKYVLDLMEEYYYGG